MLNAQGTKEHRGESTSHPSTASLRGLLDVQKEAQAKSMPEGEPSAENVPGKKKKLRPWRQKEMVIESINEFLQELEGIPGLIVNQALNHVHAHEVRCGHTMHFKMHPFVFSELPWLIIQSMNRMDSSLSFNLIYRLY